MTRFLRLTRLQRITLALFVVLVANWGIASKTGYTIVGADLIALVFVCCLILVLITGLWRATRRRS